MSIAPTLQSRSPHLAGDSQVAHGGPFGLGQSNATARFMGAVGAATKQRLNRHPVAAGVQKRDHTGLRVMPKGNVQHSPRRNATQIFTVPMRKGRRARNLGPCRVVHL